MEARKKANMAAAKQQEKENQEHSKKNPISRKNVESSARGYGRKAPPGTFGYNTGD